MAKKSKPTANEGAWYSLAVARILLGLVFLWAYFDKLFGLGFATKAAKAWVNGGSPTTGFLKGVAGPFADTFHSIAGQGWADWLFMFGLLGIGLGLLLGVAVRASVVAGCALLVMMWMASLPIKTNPLVDEHIVYIAVLLAIGFGLGQQKLSLANWWQKMPLVKSNPWLK
jgi:thiosulfate dehydrogenase [quinone] large subunit